MAVNLKYLISDAVFSPCRKYRYSLTRVWAQLRHTVVFIMLNPSTANEHRSDPTVTRCINYARAWGYGAVTVGNIFAFRSTNPASLRTVDDPIGPDNNMHLEEIADMADMVVCAWGNHGDYLGRSMDVVKLLQKHDLYGLKVTSGKGQPGHPLYLRGDITPFIWRRAGCEHSNTRNRATVILSERA